MNNNSMQDQSVRNGDRLPRSLLLVDDDELALTLLADRLHAAGYSVTTAHSGVEACEILEQRSFPVVMTDYRMPSMDGLQLVERVRAYAADNSYCIVWSICAEDQDRDRSFEHGVDDHVSKDLSDAELLARIEVGFKTIELRESLRRTRKLRAWSPTHGRDRDADAWNTAANRLHAEMLLAARLRRPLTVLMLHVERVLAPADTAMLAAAQIGSLVRAINERIRPNVDFAMPLDVAAGLARVLLVLPGIPLSETLFMRERVSAAIAESALTDEFAELRPECAVGIASIDGGGDAVVANAAELVAAAELHMERLALPMM